MMLLLLKNSLIQERVKLTEGNKDEKNKQLLTLSKNFLEAAWNVSSGL